jgi:hypothetical protein
LILQEFRVKTLGFNILKDMYRDDSDFKDAYEACENPVLRDRSQWIEYLIHDGLLLRRNQLCIPKGSMRENLLKEKYSGGLAGHFSHDKTFCNTLFPPVCKNNYTGQELWQSQKCECVM